MLFNSILIFFQMLLMGTFVDFHYFPLLNILVPILAFINLFFFVYWIFIFKWPFILFIVSFLFGHSDWALLYKFPSNSISVSNGLSILSKYPLYNKGLINFENSNNGGIYSDLKYKNDTIRIYNLHFESLHLSSNDTLNTTEYPGKIKKSLDQAVKTFRQGKTRQRIEKIFNIQEKQVLRFNEIQKTNDNFSIVCTDLNNNAFSKPYKLLSSNYKDSFAQKGSGFGTTYEISSIPFRIDFILVDPRLEVISFETYDLSLSDHRPISAVVKF